MSKLIHIGYGNVVNVEKIISIVSPDAAPIKRLVQHAKENGLAIDATLLPETIMGRAQTEDSENDEA